MDITICGLGLLGASLAMAIRQNVPGAIITGYDHPEVMQVALKKHIIDRQINAWPDDCRNAEIIFLATPQKVILQHLKDLANVVSEKTIVSDLGSTKEVVYQLLDEIHFPGRFIGGHPMTGAEKSGINAANPLLYENAVYVLTIRGSMDGLVEQKLLPLLKAIKAHILILDPGIHDQIVAVISHLPQIVAIALVRLAGQKNSADHPYFDLAAGGFRDLTRIASSSSAIWEDIFFYNKKNIEKSLEDFIAILNRYKNNSDQLSEELQITAQIRGQIPAKGKGFLYPLTDVMVYVPDQVGVIARISNALADARIDIRDIELLKIREKEGGVFRLSFGSLDEAGQAIQVIESINYQAFIKE